MLGQAISHLLGSTAVRRRHEVLCETEDLKLGPAFHSGVAEKGTDVRAQSNPRPSFTQLLAGQCAGVQFISHLLIAQD